MLYALTLVAPVVLLLLMLVMERVEEPLRHEAVGEQLNDFLLTARPEEVETFVSQGFAPALERYWSRRRSSGRRQRQTHTETTTADDAVRSDDAVRIDGSREPAEVGAGDRADVAFG